MSIVTTAAPVFSTALVMKDFVEYILTSLIFGLLNDWDITFEGNIIPTVNNEASSNSFWMYLVNFDFLICCGGLKHLQCNLNITTN